MRSINGTIRRTATTVTFVVALTGLSRLAVAKEFTFVSLNVDNRANGINNAGQIVGTFGLLDGEDLTPLDVPDSRPGSTRAHGINDSVDFVGAFNRLPPDRGFPKGFVYRDGAYTPITFEQAVEVFGINNDGYMVGRSCCRRGGNPEGFLIDPNGRVQFINLPGIWDWASGINASGQIVGAFLVTTSPATSLEALLLEQLLYVDGVYNPSGETLGTSLTGTTLAFTFAAYLYSDGVFMPFSVPGASRTQAEGINDAGQIVGHYNDATGTHGFFCDTDGTLTSLDFPGATGGTSAHGINNAGQIVGGYVDATGSHAFLATPVQ